MSESMAFIGGVAVAGLAAILLLKGTGTSLQQPNIAVAPQFPAGVIPGVMQQPPTYNPYVQQSPSPAPSGPNIDERVAIERVKIENEMLKRENEQLKNQLQQMQQAQLQTYNYQWQLNAQQNQNAAAQMQQQSQNQWWSSPIAWAVGGMFLTIGGGIVVAGVLSLFSSKQRQTRTVQVIHPYAGSTAPLIPVRRAEFLPPHAEARQVDVAEYEDSF